MLRKKLMLASVLCVVAFAMTGVGTAFGGEITGNGKPTGAPAHANSICAFSGQNDDPSAPLSLDRELAPNSPGGKSQSFGQDVELGADPQVQSRRHVWSRDQSAPGKVAEVVARPRRFESGPIDSA